MIYIAKRANIHTTKQAEENPMKAYRKFQKQVASIQTENGLKDAHIAICTACSAYEISWEQFMELRSAMKAKRTEKHIAWGYGI